MGRGRRPGRARGSARRHAHARLRVPYAAHGGVRGDVDGAGRRRRGPRPGGAQRGVPGCDRHAAGACPARRAPRKRPLGGGLAGGAPDGAARGASRGLGGRARRAGAGARRVPACTPGLAPRTYSSADRRREAGVDGWHLLVVDDEPVVRELLAATLRFAGYEVTSAATGSQALEIARDTPPCLVLLDVMLPDMDGFEVMRRLRKLPRRLSGGRPDQVPVLFLTARDTTQDKINGLRLGGDDYVTKPFDLEELLARIEAVLRRAGAAPEDRTLRVADLELDPEGLQVLRAGTPVRLSPTEFRLLHYLVLNAGRVVSKAQILEHVWRYDFAGDSSIVDTYVSYVRRKVDRTGPKLIHTMHGIGYVLRGPRS
ncbi:response regulator transcription factor [Microbispora bryophytorum]|nr:response regulator transcription factor [Microbispora bryophytorum]TQS05649.1 response regulator transcription factor [Microbispora bryophytorum]